MYCNSGFAGGSVGEEPACQCRRHKRHGFSPLIGKVPLRRAWQLTPVFLPRESPWTEEPGGLQAIGSHRVGLNCSDLVRMYCKPLGSSVHGIFQARIWVGCHFLFQGIFPTRRSNLHLLHWQVDSLPLSHERSPRHMVGALTICWMNAWMNDYECRLMWHCRHARKGFVIVLNRLECC